MDETKPTPLQVHDKLVSWGVSDLDAGLVADCLNVGKSTSWMNADDVPGNVNELFSSFISEHGYRFRIIVTPARMGKYIWDVKKLG